MGGGAFGVEAAAQFYFGKSVREVNLAEAAMMAGLFKAPTKYAPHIDLPAARARANDVLSNLVEAGFMTAGQVHAARLNPARPIETRLPYSPDWYLDWAFEEIQRVAEGRGHYVLTARTTIDLGLQQAAEQALVSTMRQQGKALRTRTPARWSPWSRTARCAPWSAASTTAKASSTAPHMRAGSPAPRSRSTSMPTRSSAV